MQPHEKELSALTKAQQEHLQDTKLAHNFYNKIVARCKEKWARLSTAEGATNTNHHTFTLVLSADYQQAKLIPHWGRSPQPASTYYLSRESYDILGIVDHRDDSGHVRLFSETIGPKNTDYTVSLLYRGDRREIPMAGASAHLHGQCHQHKQEPLLVCLGNGASEKRSCGLHPLLLPSSWAHKVCSR